MRVLNLVHQYPPEFVGGTELYTRNLAITLRSRGITPAVFTRKYQAHRPTIWQDNGVTVYSGWAGPLSPVRRFLETAGNASLQHHWRQALDTFEPDLVHVQHLMGLPATLIDEVVRRGVPFLVTLHDYWWVCANANLLTNFDGQACRGPRLQLNCTRCAVARGGGGAAWLASPALAGFLTWRVHRLGALLAQANLLLAPSEYVRRWYVGHDVPPDRVYTLPLGLNAPVMPPAPPAKGPLRLLYIGGLAPNKGVHVVLEVLREIEGDVHLEIVGDDAARPDYVKRLRELAGMNVAFRGALPHYEVWSVLRNAELVVVPSLWHETYCFTAREAIAAGVPIVASAMGALTELVENGRNGLLLPAGDRLAWRTALQELVDNRSQIAAWRGALPSIETFAAHVDQIQALYLGIAGQAERGIR